MRKYLLFLVCFFVALSSAFGQQKELQSSLENIRQGYILAGVDQLKDCANHGNVWAQFFLAQCYQYGYLGEVNPKEAFILFRKTAEKGLAIGQYCVAKCYEDGYGTNINPEKAKMWLSKSEGKFEQNALSYLASLFNTGLNFPERYGQNPPNNIASSAEGVNNNYGNINSSNAIVSNNQTINNITIVQPTSPQPVVPTQPQTALQPLKAKSDVDENIPVNSQNNGNTFALIIANENYQDVAQVPNALNDGSVFFEYCTKTLGVPESNVHLIKDATLNNIKREINLIKQITEAFKGQANLIVYYAGHGIPDESTREAYILPIDGYSSDLSTCYSLNSLYETLGKMQSSQIVVMLDACFSGSLRGEGMLSTARGVAIKPKQNALSSNMVVFSATQGDETAYAYAKQGHGLFTYYLLKKIKETKGNVTLGDLSEYIMDNVLRTSLIENKKSQTPTVISGMQPVVWKQLKLVK